MPVRFSRPGMNMCFVLIRWCLYRLSACNPRIQMAKYWPMLFKKLGIQPVFASSNRNPLSGLKELASASKAGARLVISPDGPRGPARQMAMGPVAVAQLTGAPIIPILWSCDRFWRVNSWDRLRIPKPFSKAVRVIGQPIYLPPTSDKTAREAQRVMVEEQLNALVKTADEMMGVAE